MIREEQEMNYDANMSALFDDDLSRNHSDSERMKQKFLQNKEKYYQLVRGQLDKIQYIDNQSP